MYNGYHHCYGPSRQMANMDNYYCDRQYLPFNSTPVGYRNANSLIMDNRNCASSQPPLMYNYSPPSSSLIPSGSVFYTPYSPQTQMLQTMPHSPQTFNSYYPQQSATCCPPGNMIFSPQQRSFNSSASACHFSPPSESCRYSTSQDFNVNISSSFHSSFDPNSLNFNVQSLHPTASTFNRNTEEFTEQHQPKKKKEPVMSNLISNSNQKN